MSVEPFILYAFELLILSALLWLLIRKFIKNRVLRLAILTFLIALALCPTVIVGDKGAVAIPFGVWLWFVIMGDRESSSNYLLRIGLVLIIWPILYLVLGTLEAFWRRRSARKRNAAG